MAQQNADAGTGWQKIRRIAWRIAIVLAFVFTAKLCVDWLFAKIALLDNDAAARAMMGLIVTILIGYAVLLAIPFVPGVEIGIAILLIEGSPAAPFVYLATIFGLFLAFSIGQYAPLDRLIRFCSDLCLFRIAALLESIKVTPRKDRLDAMNARLPSWLAPILCDYRYVTLAIAINLPGNIALGGGGGIMMASGLSRLFQTKFVALTILLATLPVPLAVWLLGTDIIQ